MYALALIVAVVLIIETIAFKTYSSTIGTFYKKWFDDHKEWFDANQERVDAYVKRLGNFHEWLQDVCSKPAVQDAESK